MWGVRPTRGASLRVELELGDRRALMSATARTPSSARARRGLHPPAPPRRRSPPRSSSPAGAPGDRRTDVGRGARRAARSAPCRRRRSPASAARSWSPRSSRAPSCPPRAIARWQRGVGCRVPCHAACHRRDHGRASAPIARNMAALRRWARVSPPGTRRPGTRRPGTRRPGTRRLTTRGTSRRCCRSAMVDGRARARRRPPRCRIAGVRCAVLVELAGAAGAITGAITGVRRRGVSSPGVLLVELYLGDRRADVGRAVRRGPSSAQTSSAPPASARGPPQSRAAAAHLRARRRR